MSHRWLPLQWPPNYDRVKYKCLIDESSIDCNIKIGNGLNQRFSVFLGIRCIFSKKKLSLKNTKYGQALWLNGFLLVKGESLLNPKKIWLQIYAKLDLILRIKKMVIFSSFITVPKDFSLKNTLFTFYNYKICSHWILPQKPQIQQ